MSTVNTAQPAFPITYEWLNKSDANAFAPDGSVVPPWQSTRITQHGMSLRDYFAGEVLPVCYAETCKEMEKTGWVVDWRMGVALDAYRMADAMLAARTTGARDE